MAAKRTRKAGGHKRKTPAGETPAGETPAGETPASGAPASKADDAAADDAAADEPTDLDRFHDHAERDEPDWMDDLDFKDYEHRRKEAARVRALIIDAIDTRNYAIADAIGEFVYLCRRIIRNSAGRSSKAGKCWPG